MRRFEALCVAFNDEELLIISENVMKKRKKKKKTLGNNPQTLYIKALRAFILSRLIVCTFGRRRFISDLKAVFDGVL